MRDYLTKANEGGIPDSITATKLGAGEANSLFVEAKTAVSSSGQTLANAAGTSEVTDQLSKALAVYGAGGATYCVDTGAANAYVLNPVSPKKAVPALFDGLTLTFNPSVTNSATATINYNSLGARGVRKLAGLALIGGELQQYTATTVVYDASAGYFVIVSPLYICRSQTFTVGSGGNFTTIRGALAYLSLFKKIKYYTTGLPDPVITLSLVAGYVMNEQIACDAIDFSWVTITGVSAETSVNSTGFSISINGTYPVFSATNGGKLPRLSQLFRVASGAPATVYGVYCYGTGSSVEVTSGSGVIDAGGRGAHIANGAAMDAPSTYWNNAGTYGVYCYNARVNLTSATIHTTGSDGVFAVNSSVVLSSAAITSATGNGVQFQSCIVTANGLDIINSGAVGALCIASVVDLRNSTIDVTGTHGVYSSGAATVTIEGATITNSNPVNVNVGNGGIVNGNGAVYTTTNQAHNTLTDKGIIFGSF